MEDTENKDNVIANAHAFHNNYRASGIALCVSLAALAASESWWFYGFLKGVLKSENDFQRFMYFPVPVSALAVIFLSFYVQYKHYQGMKSHARVYGLLLEGKTIEDDAVKEKWQQGNEFFTNADKKVKWLIGSAFFNFVWALCYIALFTPGIF